MKFSNPNLSNPVLAAGFLTVFALMLIWVIPFEPDHSWGWDESMNAALPAADMVAALQAGEPNEALQVAVQDCQFYPFVFPTFLATAQFVLGLSETVSRSASRALFCFGLFGLFLLAAEVAGSLRRNADFESRRATTGIAFGALALGALCPLAFAFSGTLFLEVPFLTAEIFCLRAWVRRQRICSPDKPRSAELRADLVVGLWLTICFFTKFNYACLLFGALFLDLTFQALSAARVGNGKHFAWRVARMGFPFGVALAWWFGLPLPGGLQLGEEHRESFAFFLNGNRDVSWTPWARRILDLFAAFVPTARFGLLVLSGLLFSLRVVREPSIRLLWCVLLGFAIPMSMHPFHLERFFIPLGASVWVLAAVGLVGLFQRLARVVPSLAIRWALGVFVVVSCLAFPERDSRFVAKQVGIWNEDQRDYLTWLFGTWRDLTPNRRLPTAGLSTETATLLHELVASEVKLDERFGWIGISSELSPAALHLGTLQHGVSIESFRRRNRHQLYLDFRSFDPAWSDERFADWASKFDVIFFTDPPDIKSRRSRTWTASYVERLQSKLGWTRRELGKISIDRPLNDPTLVTLFASRPPK